MVFIKVLHHSNSSSEQEMFITPKAHVISVWFWYLKHRNVTGVINNKELNQLRRESTVSSTINPQVLQVLCYPRNSL